MLYLRGTTVNPLVDRLLSCKSVRYVKYTKHEFVMRLNVLEKYPKQKMTDEDFHKTHRVRPNVL